MVNWCRLRWRSDSRFGMVKKLIFGLVCLLSAWSVLAQQVMPELDAQRTYISFGEAAEKIIAAAVARSNPGETEKVSQAESFRRIVEYAKQNGVKANADIGGTSFSYMSFLPSLAGKLNGELASYTFASGVLIVAIEREQGAFSYRMRPTYATPFNYGPRGFPARIYEPDMGFAFKTLPVIRNGVLSYTNLCTTASASCFALNAYKPGTFKWFYRDSGQPWIVACNQVSDCVQAFVSMTFYNWTYKYRRSGYDESGQYWGNYKVAPSGTCNDTSEYSYLAYGLITGLTCIFSQQYNYSTGASPLIFSVAGDFESSFLRYISLNPVPVICPVVTKYPQLLECDARFADDVLTISSIVRLVDRMYFWGTQRAGYRGVKYTVVTKADALGVLGNTLVKVSSLAEEIKPPAATAPAPAASSPASGPAVDLGPDPGVSAPSLEDITAESVLAPIWDLFPSLRSYNVGSYGVKCPVFTSSLYGRSFLIDAHCQLAEGQRLALGVVSLIAWACTALIVVIRA